MYTLSATMSNQSASQHDAGTTAEYNCDQGYQLSGGDHTRMCANDDCSPTGINWNGQASECVGNNRLIYNNNSWIMVYILQMYANII